MSNNSTQAYQIASSLLEHNHIPDEYAALLRGEATNALNDCLDQSIRVALRRLSDQRLEQLQAEVGSTKSADLYRAVRTELYRIAQSSVASKAS